MATDLFERRACVDCHEVRREGTAAEPLWKVTPVKLPDIWMPQARFDHAEHGTSLTPCSTCHTAETSKTASDVLMPRIETCRDCHGGERGEAAPVVERPLWSARCSSAGYGRRVDRADTERLHRLPRFPWS